MQPIEAQRVVEELRKGIPPLGYTKHFTVGRTHEIETLERSLHNGDAPVLLLQANYGSGKSHLLRYIRDHALAEGYAVSFVTLDAKAGVRFNRMDQNIVGAHNPRDERKPDRLPGWRKRDKATETDLGDV